MRKKILAVALAATMVVSSALTAFAATASEFSGTVWVDNTGDEELEGNFDITYTFNNKTSGTNNWDNFIIEFWSDSVSNGDTGKGFMSVRSDAHGWFAEGWKTDTQGDLTSDLWTKAPENFDDWAATMADADVTINAKRAGETITITYAIAGKNGKSYDLELSATNSVGFGDKIKVHLTAENCKLASIVFKNNGTNSDPAPTTTTKAGDTATTTTAAAGTTTPTGSGGTGDAATTVAFVIVMIAAAGAVLVLKRKKVTE